MRTDRPPWPWLTGRYHPSYYFELEGGAGGIGDPEDHEQCPPADNSFPEDKDGSSYHEHYDAEPTGGYGAGLGRGRCCRSALPCVVPVGILRVDENGVGESDSAALVQAGW